MRLAFISDIHGNAVALDAVLKDIETRNVDKVFVLGDICYRGPEPKRALQLVQSLNCEVIKGNADEWVVRGVKAGEVPDQAFDMMTQEREWIYAQLDSEDIEYLQQLPTNINFSHNGMNIHAFHATPSSLFDIVLPSETDATIEEKLLVEGTDISIYAHIHKPYIRYIKGKCVMNIGSVGLPFDGTRKSSYAIVDVEESSFQTSIVRVDYDVERVIQQYQEVNYPNAQLMAKVLENASL
ncbi:metallophosphoesterase family protein [Lederbergia graminis]|uniref:Phosphoesterase n=1 Tax=Lederbergia graminis TaxID=735518 RepID=A0ABW0LGP1_9BACI